MPTHAHLAGKLLDEAANFFVALGEQNEEIKKEMAENAVVFRQLSHLINTKPEGSINEKTHAQLAERLLLDAAAFFRTLGENNAPLKEQMEENAQVYEQIAKLVAQNPLGVLE